MCGMAYIGKCAETFMAYNSITFSQHRIQSATSIANLTGIFLVYEMLLAILVSGLLIQIMFFRIITNNTSVYN